MLIEVVGAGYGIMVGELGVVKIGLGEEVGGGWSDQRV